MTPLAAEEAVAVPLVPREPAGEEQHPDGALVLRYYACIGVTPQLIFAVSRRFNADKHVMVR
jgi:hypothetical protein